MGANGYQDLESPRAGLGWPKETPGDERGGRAEAIPSTSGTVAPGGNGVPHPGRHPRTTTRSGRVREILMRVTACLDRHAVRSAPLVSGYLAQDLSHQPVPGAAWASPARSRR